MRYIIKKKSLIIFGIYLIVLSPLIDVKFAHLRIEQISMIFILGYKILMALATSKPFINKKILFYIVFALSFSFIALISVLVSGKFLSSFVINFPFKIILYSVISYELSKYLKKHFSFNEIIDLLFNLGAIVAIIGIIQYMEFKGILPSKIILKIINVLYPSPGELDPIFVAKSGGYAIKSGAIGRITSTFEGHPILLANYFALMLPITSTYITNKSRFLKWLMMIVALLLTLSRGSILSVAVGLFINLILISFYNRKYSLKILSNYFFAVLVLFIVLYFGGLETIIWRFQGTIETIAGSGVDEGRITHVWPEMIEHMNNSGALNWVFGNSNFYGGPTDSMYMLLILRTGVIGVGLFIIFHLYLLFNAMISLRKKKHQLMDMDLFSISIISMIITLLINYIVHPMWQGDRFISMFFVIISLHYLNESNKKCYKRSN